MSDRLVIDDITVEITDRNFGAGGQGQAFKGHLVHDPNETVVIKALPVSTTAIERAEAIAQAALPTLSPFLAGPLSAKAIGDQLYHVAPLAEGSDLEQDRPRTFPEQLEIAHHLMCQIAILEDAGIAHGDYAPGNIKIDANGAVTPFDFDNALLPDPSVPAPDMAGQHMMLAPEIRSGQSGVTIESDRFAFAVLLNMILLGRHPAAGIATNPAEIDRTMSLGRWPERDRKAAPDETPIGALGRDIPKLFDAAFSTTPAKRPSADIWRRALQGALQSTWIHDCGNAFVLSARRKTCPWCGGKAVAKEPAAPSLVILVPGAGAKFRTTLKDGETLTLGRTNLPGMGQTVSSRHLEVTRHKDQLLLRHLGRNPTLIQLESQWYRLNETWIAEADMQKAPLSFKLADVAITLGIE